MTRPSGPYTPDSGFMRELHNIDPKLHAWFDPRIKRWRICGEDRRVSSFMMKDGSRIHAIEDYWRHVMNVEEGEIGNTRYLPLDGRTLAKIKAGHPKFRTYDEIFAEIDENNRRLDEEKDRRFREECEDIALHEHGRLTGWRAIDNLGGVISG